MTRRRGKKRVNYIHEEHLHRVVAAMRATGDGRGELLTGIIRRSVQEQWPTSWLIAALAQHIQREQAEELAHQERAYYTQSLLIGEQNFRRRTPRHARIQGMAGATNRLRGMQKDGRRNGSDRRRFP